MGRRQPRFDTGSDFNQIILSTVIGASPSAYYGLGVIAASSNSVYNSYVQGSTAALISGSTGTVIRGTFLAATNAIGSALALSSGSVNLTIATSTLLATSLGRGLALNPGNTGVVSLGT